MPELIVNKKSDKEEINLLIELVIPLRYYLNKNIAVNNSYRNARDWLIKNGYISETIKGRKIK